MPKCTSIVAWEFNAQDAYYRIAVQTEGTIKGNILVYDSQGNLVSEGEFDRDSQITTVRDFKASQEQYLIVIDGEGVRNSKDQYTLIVEKMPYLFYDEFGKDQKDSWEIKEGTYFSQNDMLIINDVFSATLENDFGEKYIIQHSSTLQLTGEEDVYLDIKVKEQDDFNYLAFNCTRQPSWDVSWECEWVKVVDGTRYIIPNSNLTIGMLSTSTIIVNQNVYQNLDDGNIVFEFTDDTFQEGDIGFYVNPSGSTATFKYFILSAIP